MQPIFKLKINRKELTEAMIDRILEIKVEDAAGYANDNCVVTIDGREPYPKFPLAGAMLDVYFGYAKMSGVKTELPLKLLGHYELADFDWDGPPWNLTLNFNALSMRDTPKTSRNETYENMTVGEIVKKAVGRMGYAEKQAVIHPMYFKDTSPDGKIPFKLLFEHQENITDMEFVNILAMRYAAFPKVQGETFRFQPKTGENMVDQDLLLEHCLPGTVNFHSQVRAAYDNIRAITFSYDTGAITGVDAEPSLAAMEAKKAEASGDAPKEEKVTMQLSRMYDTVEKATAAAYSKGEFLDSSLNTLSFKTGGNPLLQSHRKLNLSGDKWHPDIPKKWIIVSSTHLWKKGDGDSDGYTTEVKCERLLSDSSLQKQSDNDENGMQQ
jgi:uncharacterized protein